MKHVGSLDALPVLSIAYNVASMAPVIINLYPDWEQTGECKVSYIKLEELIEACRLLTFVIDAAADEVYVEQKKRMLREAPGGEDIPS